MRSVIANGSTAIVDGRKVVHLCSNDYLGLSRSRSVIAAASSLGQISQCSSRLIAGNHPSLTLLEDLLASHRLADRALVFPTGYMANLGAVTALANNSTTIFSDEFNHASIIDACKLSGAKVRIFRHNDTRHLAHLMQKSVGKKIVITEGVFSMDGDISNMAQICALAKRHEAMTIVDDAHGDFLLGENYSGVPALSGAPVDVHVSSLSKGLGCFGGYVAASGPIIELLVNSSRQFIYTSALPEHLCNAAIAAMRIAKRGRLQPKLRRNIRYLTQRLRKAGLQTGTSESQIIPIMIGSEERTVRLSEEFLSAGFFCQAVRYPTVRKGEARLRITVTAEHSTRQLGKAADSLGALASRHTNGR
jgi:glycine C-acetyltransferase